MMFLFEIYHQNSQAAGSVLAATDAESNKFNRSRQHVSRRSPGLKGFIGLILMNDTYKLHIPIKYLTFKLT